MPATVQYLTALIVALAIGLAAGSVLGRRRARRNSQPRTKDEAVARSQHNSLVSLVPAGSHWLAQYERVSQAKRDGATAMDQALLDDYEAAAKDYRRQLTGAFLILPAGAAYEIASELRAHFETVPDPTTREAAAGWVLDEQRGMLTDFIIKADTELLRLNQADLPDSSL